MTILYTQTTIRTGMIAAATALGAAMHAASAAESLEIDGSSTVYPVTEAMAEDFQKAYPDVHVTVGVSGTGGGFEQLCSGRIAIADASRPIDAEERQSCRENGVEYIELPVALDALTVVVNTENDWAQCMTLDELKSIWQPEAQGKVLSWSQVRKGWPARDLSLFGPGADSGTFDYFTEVVMGEAGKIRGDFTASEDDNVLVQGVARDPGGLGYFGLAYYVENKDSLKSVAIDAGEGCVQPSLETAKNGSYQPLSRPLFIYVSKEAAALAHVQAFIDFYLDPSRAGELVAQVGYVPLPRAAYELAAQNFKDREFGTVFASGDLQGASIEELLQLEKRH